MAVETGVAHNTLARFLHGRPINSDVFDRLAAALPTSPPALDAATLERAIYNAGLQLVEAGKYNVAPAVGSILRVRAEYARLAEQPKEPQP